MILELNGKITEGGEWDILYIGDESLVDFASIVDGRTIKLRYYISNNPINKEKVVEDFLRSFYEGLSEVDGTYYYSGSLQTQPENQVVVQLKKEMKELTGQDGIYSAFIFKGEKTVMVKSMNIEFAASYIRDGDYIKITATDGELILRIKSQNTLHGEGFASGVYTKLKPGEKLPTVK